MRKNVALLLVLILVASCLIKLSKANANAKTIIVPDDYPTIAAAIGNATSGDKVFFREGSYDGPINKTLKIDKSISLIGENVENTVINLHPKYNVTWILTTPFYSYSDAMRVDANDVTIFNLTLTFIGNIKINGKRVQIICDNLKSHSTATGLIINGSNCNVANNFVLGRISLESDSNIMVRNEFNSLQIMSANNNLIESNNFNCLVIYSSNGNIISKNNISTELVSNAVYLANSSYNVFHYNNISVDLWNTNIGIEPNSHDNTFYLNGFFYDYPDHRRNPDFDVLYNNKELVSTHSGMGTNFWDNGEEGNYWQNYNGSDANRDGIGDTPYIIGENNIDNHPLMQQVNVSLIQSIITQVPVPVVSLLRIKVVFPMNQTYNASSVSLVFAIHEPVNWTGYSLDGKTNVTVTGNVTIPGLSNGLHKVIVYANDTYGNMEASETISFTIAIPDTFPIASIATVSVATVAVVGVGLLVYFKKRKR